MPEPAALVGMQTGQHYATLGDNPMGPETMSVQPPGAPQPVQPPPGIPVSMEQGGTAQVGAPGGWATTLKQPFATNAATPQAPSYDQNQFDWLRRSLNMSQEGLLGAQGARLDARAATMPYYQRQLDAQRAVLPYSYGVLNARQGLIGPQQGVIGANRAVLGARGQSLAANRGYIAQQQGANAAELADIQAIRAARANLPDIMAVAQEGQLRRQVDRSLYNRIGVEAPAEVEVEPGQENQLPSNMRAKLQTQADIKRTQARDNAEVRANQLANARLAVALIDTNVDEAQIKASEAGLTLEQARLLVDQAQLDEGRAELGAKGAGFDLAQSRLGEDQAELGESRARLGESQARYNLGRFDDPKDEGYELYTDPVTLQRSWVTPADADRRRYDYSMQQGYDRYPAQYAQQQYQQQYQTQQQAQGDPLAGFTNDDFVSWLATGPQGSRAFGVSGLPQQIMASLVARYQRQGFDAQRAHDLAAQDMAILRAKADAARAAAARAAGGGGHGED